jgi:hypothetical protein
MDPTATSPALAQGAYFLATGLWPILHMRSFEAVTGRKRERWLVKTVGVLVGAIGASLLVGARERRMSPETRLLGQGSALGLAAIDTWYVLRRRISPIYLADAAAELLLAGVWARR